MNRRLLLGLAGYPVLAVALAFAWDRFAPRAECYLDKGECFYQYDQTASPYFMADVWFGGLALVAGLVTAIAVGHRLWRHPMWQIGFAAAGWIAGKAAQMLAESWSQVVIVSEDLGVDRLELRTPGMLLVWPLMLQLAVLVLGERESESAEPS